ncbi:MAG: type I DNA topoisomerase [Anaerolineales bacterium]|nr:type I DNA topoisomerase [Chloroflexota bacterium]MBL6982083.1 type I DNA topoisomerase [Anaerolineales bacterium]
MGRTAAHEGLEPPEVTKRSRKKEIKRSGKLVIVESPAKAKTVGRFLGKGYKVEASVGHVRDLLRSQLSVDVENDFQPKYRVPNEKRDVVKKLKAEAAKAEEVYLATDLDREGEAIAWHLMESAEIEPERTRRVVFHEITRPAIEDAFAHTRSLDMDLINAQQGRRILDRLVGYSISPILWKKVRGRLSAGRVQSVALRLIVEREREIDAFDPEEYWSISAEFSPNGDKEKFTAKLVRVDGEKPLLSKEEDVTPLLIDMEKAKYIVSKAKKGTRKRKPQAPFITSTMQQSASRRLRFTARRTMRIAQQLYEGVDVGNGGQTGLITYMRTDSTNVSALAQDEARNFIVGKYGDSYVPESPPKYRTKARGAQEAHEAVRPTSVFRTPKSIKDHLSRDQYRMYQLIWQRFVASQMSNAIFDTISVEIDGTEVKHKYLLRATGSTIRFPGFLVVYKDISKKSEEEMPVPTNLTVGQLLKLIRLIPEQHFTQPPPRFSDASLVKDLEENGIGRPSTYAPILSTLQNRGYVTREKRRLFPTETGIVVNDLLVEHFPEIVDINFTAGMEKDLDQVATGKKSWVEIVRDFYGPFEKQLELAIEKMPEVNAGPELVGRECPECSNELVIRWGRHGKFIGCSNFPKCRYTEPWLEKIGVKCPEDSGELVIRKTRKGRVFYGCTNYPECEFSSWKLPIRVPCPKCSGLLVAENKNHVVCLSCDEQFLRDDVITDDTVTELA